MKYRIFSENDWVYPDSDINEGCQCGTAKLYAPRRSDVCFQILTDILLDGTESFSVSSTLGQCDVEVYQLLAATCKENSGPKTYTTLKYEDVSSFVTRKAPFDVYEVTKPLDKGELEEGRAAFYIRLNVPSDAVPGIHNGDITIKAGTNDITVPVELKIYNTTIPALKDANFHMINWLFYERLEDQYNTERRTEKYESVLRENLRNQLDMRNDYIMIPAGEPIRDESGKVVDFDFSFVEYVGNIALEEGFKYIMGGFVARFIKWDDPDNALLWDKDVGCTTIEGYRQLKIYFTRAWECVTKNNWQNNYMQCLVDEPQFPNSLAYRALSGICRKNMPGVIINDPVETTDIAGAVDVWVVKQAVFEKHLENFQKLQSFGEEMWIYTCGFPAGSMMNRIVDLPLSASRLPMWMCCKYGCPGFLHWGYNAHKGESERADVCSAVSATTHYPPGNAHVVYTGDGRPWYSVRGHLQRAGSYDAELLIRLGKKDHAKALELIEKCCRTFDDYEFSPEVIDKTRVEILEILG
ncbi:MAG: DUF4091 domain-containing protein [Ruminococcaceae bacterium]|nr:DUF4091 domain-containing protein [Oscillospiraceae bacterium]